jgi:hypothetical protein
MPGGCGLQWGGNGDVISDNSSSDELLLGVVRGEKKGREEGELTEEGDDMT